MSKKLVAYFSASGVTRALAERFAEAIGADLYEIRPEVPYTNEDLNWMDKKSRSSIEMGDESSRPALADRDANVGAYDEIFVGFPVWWYREPCIIDTFLEAYDFTGKTVIPFATSGSSGLGKTAAHMQGVAPAAKVLEGKRFDAKATADELKAWAESL